MLDREEIKKRLEGVHPQLCVAFAIRCSLRALPLLVSYKKMDAFWYWGDERLQHVLAVLIAQRVSVTLSISAFCNKTNVSTPATYNIGTAAYTAANEIGNVAVSFVEAAFYVVTSIADTIGVIIDETADVTESTADVAVKAVDAANVVTTSTEININLESSILSDLRVIACRQICRPNMEDFLYSPLWSEVPPKNWQNLYQNFTKSLLELDAGFDIWVD